MKIGILTFHRAHNYGAVLQCYALQEILKGMGHDVRVIDYRQPWIEEFYKILSFKMLRRRMSSLSSVVEYLRNSLKKFLWSPCRRSYFKDFRETYLDMTSECLTSIPQDFDCYVIGSDQLWSLHCLGGEYDRVYLGEFDRSDDSILIGYAISADVKSVQGLESSLKDLLPSFKAISMREQKIAEIVTSCSGCECMTCMDPTLLTEASLWNPVTDSEWASRKYVLVYEVRWKKETKGLLKRKAVALANKLGPDYEVLDVSRMRYPVKDFLSMFRYASYVVTTSFHGIVFSMLFETPFYAFPLWESYDLRYRELLESVGASDRLMDPEADLEPKPIDFVPLKEALGRMKRESLDFLKNNIER